jgi:segregation and condensation protein B
MSDPIAPDLVDSEADDEMQLGVEREVDVRVDDDVVDITDDSMNEGMGAPSLASALEALLLVTDEPLDVSMLAQLVRRPIPDVEAELTALVADYDSSGRGFELREVAGGWRFYTRDTCREVVERFVRDGQLVRLTQASLETLAVVAYKQPVSRMRVSAIRGVNVDGVMRTLASRGLVEETGSDPESGAILYRTTAYFLERLGLRSLDELPELAPLLPDPESAEEFLHASAN